MHPELLKATVQACREYIDAGDCHGAPPPIERLIEAVVQLADAPAANAAELARLADAFERSADWLDKGVLTGMARTHPLVGTADYRKAAKALRRNAGVASVAPLNIEAARVAVRKMAGFSSGVPYPQWHECVQAALAALDGVQGTPDILNIVRSAEVRVGYLRGGGALQRGKVCDELAENIRQLADALGVKGLDAQTFPHDTPMGGNTK